MGEMWGIPPNRTIVTPLSFLSPRENGARTQPGQEHKPGQDITQTGTYTGQGHNPDRTQLVMEFRIQKHTGYRMTYLGFI